MCFVSVLTQQIPQQQPNWQTNWNIGQLTEMKQIIERLDRIDKALGLRDCKDELKAEFLRTLLDRIEHLERQQLSRGQVDA